MKVTAVISDEFIVEAMELSDAATITDALKEALRFYVRNQKLKQIGATIANEPLEFKYFAQELRNLNRQ